MHSSILAKGKTHPNFAINLLNDLLTVSDKPFIFIVEKTQDACDSDEDLSTEQTIRNYFTKQKIHIRRDLCQLIASKFINIAVEGKPSPAIAEW